MPQHIVIKGRSGCGKSWLYKKVLEEQRAYFVDVSLANANLQAGLIAAVKKRVLGGVGELSQSGRAAGRRIGFEGTGLSGSDSTTHTHIRPDDWLACVKEVRRRADAKKRGCKAFVVLENFEAIRGSASARQEIISMVMNLDDAAYAEYDVRLIIVGTPHNLYDFLVRGQEDSLRSRLIEVPEVGRMPEAAAKALLKRGFVDHLAMSFDHGEDRYLRDMAWMADRIPQKLQHLGLCVALCARENGNKITEDVLKKARGMWLSQFAAGMHAAISQHLRMGTTGAQSRAKVLYAIAQFDREQFSHNDIYNVLKRKVSKKTSAPSTSTVKRTLQSLGDS
ncbi:MAG: AAA family ATPase, partial [Maricaulaceae bacterium]